MRSEKGKLARFTDSHRVQMRGTDSMETEIANLLKDFGNENDEHKKNYMFIKYQSKTDEIKTLGNKIIEI